MSKYQLEWRSRSQFFGFIICIFMLGLVVGVLFVPSSPPVGKGVGHMEREVSQPYLFDKPLNKGIENLTWK